MISFFSSFVKSGDSFRKISGLGSIVKLLRADITAVNKFFRFSFFFKFLRFDVFGLKYKIYDLLSQLLSQILQLKMKIKNLQTKKH